MKFELYLHKHLKLEQVDKWISTLQRSLQNCYKLRSGLNANWVATLASTRLIGELIKRIARLSEDKGCRGAFLHTLVYTRPFPAQFYNLSAIWNQVRVLYLENSFLLWNEGTQNLFSSLHNLQELSLYDISHGFRPKSEGPGWREVPALNMNINSRCLEKLTLCHVGFECFYDRSYLNLVELSYTTRHRGTVVLRDRALTLSNLRILSVTAYWPLIRSINAPNIEVVKMRGGHMVHLEDICMFKLRPQVLYIHIKKSTDQAFFKHALNALSIPSLIDLRLEQDNFPKLDIDLLQRMLGHVKRGLSVRWNGAQVTGNLEQMATWTESGRLEGES
ncbi:15718_t:CDS:1 [Acaulospora colombiana]|uniref:15718_t:CDS:1 n=1 Tax=Acaulospora colombiana TaxID=27376 RepID=A0ACA9NF16_9GLOM|nr:15718_t:CDS:1 [Acaulospora colombiana]